MLNIHSPTAYFLNKNKYFNFIYKNIHDNILKINKYFLIVLDKLITLYLYSNYKSPMKKQQFKIKV